MTGVSLIIILALLGLGLLLLEIFLPGLVAGMLGGLCLMVSVGQAYHQFGFRTALLVILSELVLVALGFWSWSKFFPKTALGRRMILTEFNQPAEYEQEKDFFTNEEGVAVSELRPAGTAEFSGRRCDVVSENAFISAGEKVKIQRIDKYRVVVRKIENP